jgi:cyclophilin family peptidyl-prolyl cis-trans isomerase
MTQSKRKIKAEAKKKAEQRIQIIAGIVILLVIGGIVWAVLSSQKPAATAASEPTAVSQPANSVAPTAPADKPAASSAPAAAAAEKKTYSAYPEMTIDKAKKYTATFKLAKGGEFTIQLFPDKAPKTVNSFVFLAREKFFDGTTFHRVLEGFMAQGGDPTGTGSGGPGYEFINEDSDLKFDKPGVLAMANAGRDTNGSQFFITFVATPQLDGGYTIFGQVTGGMDVVNGITRRDPQTGPDFTGDVIESVTITEQ